MPVTSYLLASCPEYFRNFHVASRVPEVDTTWESRPQYGLTFAAVDTQDSTAAKRFSPQRLWAYMVGTVHPESYTSQRK